MKKFLSNIRTNEPRSPFTSSGGAFLSICFWVICIALKIIVCILFLGFFQPNSIAGAIQINEAFQKQALSSTQYYIEKENQAHSIQEIIINEPKFLESEKQLTIGYNVPPTWIKIDIDNQFNYPKELLLEIRNAILYQVKMYKVVNHEIVDSAFSGNFYNKSLHQKDHRYSLFDLSLKENENASIYIYINNKGNNWFFPCTIYTPEAFNNKEYVSQFIMGTFYGIVLLVLIFNIFLLIYIKKSVVLFYTLFMIFMCGFQFIRDGFLFDWFMPEIPGYTFQLISITIPLAIFFNLKFFDGYVNLKSIHPTLHKTFRIAQTIPLILVLISLVHPSILLQYLGFFGIMASVLVLFTCTRIYKQAPFKITWYILGYSPMLISTILMVLGGYVITFHPFVQEHILKFSMALDFIILSIAILINFVKERRESEVLAMEQLKEINALSMQVQEELKSQIELNKKRAKSEMKALRAQMNPHFTFNVMNSIQAFLYQNDNKQARKYLSKFSRLMRKILDSSKEMYVSIHDEIEMLDIYMELESVRFGEQFKDWEFDVDESISVEEDYIPSMILQPFVENAIWHGLMHKKDGEGKIKIKFFSQDDLIHVHVIDNGIGLEEAAKIKKDSQHKSRALSIIKERLDLLQKSDNIEIGYFIAETFDEKGKSTGTKVTVTIPQLD